MKYLVLCALLTSSTSLAAGWTQLKGEHYVKVWNQSLVGTAGFMNDGSVVELGETYSDHSVSAYVEYGLSDDWTAILTLNPFGSSSFGSSSTVYVGQTALGVRRALLKDKNRIAVQGLLGYSPGIGETSLGSGTAEGYVYSWSPTVKNVRADGQIQYGRGLEHGWLSATAGVQYNGNENMSSVVMVSGQAGRQTKIGLTLSLAVEAYLATKDIYSSNVSGAGQTQYVGVTPELAYWINDHWAVGLTPGLAVYAQNNAATPSLQFNIQHK